MILKDILVGAAVDGVGDLIGMSWEMALEMARW